MIQITVPEELTNAAVHQMLSSISRSVTLNNKPAEISYAEEPSGRVRINAVFETDSGERYHLNLELTPV